MIQSSKNTFKLVALDSIHTNYIRNILLLKTTNTAKYKNMDKIQINESKNIIKHMKL